MRRHIRTVATTSLAVVLAGCSASGTATPARPEQTTSASSPTTTPPAPAGDASVAVCAAYANATGLPRQVVATASSKPVLGPAFALLLVNFRGIVSVATVPADPGLQAAFVELTAAVDDLSAQSITGLPAGADAITTPVVVRPARLAAALDTADSLCTIRGVRPKAG